MSYLTIEVWDATGNKKQTVEVPADAAVNRLIAVLVEKMNLPRHSPDGQMMSYKLHHRASGRQLLDTETLSTASVREGDILRLQPEITAGSGFTNIIGGMPWLCTKKRSAPVDVVILEFDTTKSRGSAPFFVQSRMLNLPATGKTAIDPIRRIQRRAFGSCSRE